MKTYRSPGYVIIVVLLAFFVANADEHEADPLQAVLVTGASSGIGLRITEHLTQQGYFVYAGARKDADLKRLDAMKNVQSIRLDVNRKDQIEAAVKTIEDANIVNISSLRSYTAAGNYGEYCISKAGMSMVTKLFAVRLAEYGINVHEISPGIIHTDMTSDPSVQDHYNAKIAAGMTPINRWGKPEEVGRAIAAIGRGDFPFSTGNVYHVDGGWHLRHL